MKIWLLLMLALTSGTGMIVKPRFNFGNPDPGKIELALDQFHRFAAVLDAHMDAPLAAG